MKVKNLEIGIKIGNKEKKFTNLILDSYLDLFADSFISFKQKNLPYCLVSFSKGEQTITFDSNTIKYDTILEADFSQNKEILTENNIINKYYYINPVTEYPYLEEFAGKQIMKLGFANWDEEKKDYVMYAYLDVSKYNILIQENQPIIISRIDKISSDMNFWSNSEKVKAPIHLTGRGLVEIEGMDYFNIYSKFYSVGFGVLPYKFITEYLAEDLNISRGGVGEVLINEVFQNYAKEDLFPSQKLFPSENLYPKSPTANLLIYKFKLYKETYPNPEEPPVYEDTGMYYTQYKTVDKYGKISLSVKYERS